MEYLAGKSPVSFLFEQCVKRRLTPVFEVENDSGPVHGRVFEVKVTAGEFVGTGSGSSKKKAKHLAALEALNQIMGSQQSDGSVNESLASREMVAKPRHPVGELQELTQKQLLPPPLYEFEMSAGPPPVQEFTCTVQLMKLTAVGTGKSKKIAKKEAAQALLDAIKVDDLACQLDETLKCFSKEFIIPQGEMRSAYQDLKEGRKQSSRCFLTGGCGAKPVRTEPSYCDLLQEVADEQKFEITYVDLPEPTSTGLNQCVVQLTTVPVAICHGAGRTIEEAHSRAALNTLHYLGTLINNSV